MNEPARSRLITFLLFVGGPLLLVGLVAGLSIWGAEVAENGLGEDEHGLGAAREILAQFKVPDSYRLLSEYEGDPGNAVRAYAVTRPFETPSPPTGFVVAPPIGFDRSEPGKLLATWEGNSVNGDRGCIVWFTRYEDPIKEVPWVVTLEASCAFGPFFGKLS